MYVRAALAYATQFFAGDGCDAGTCVDNECLGLAMGAKVSGDVVIHEVSGVAVKRCRMQVHVHHVSPIHGQSSLIQLLRGSVYHGNFLLSLDH